MFYYIKNVEKSISLCPKDIGMKITEIITERSFFSHSKYQFFLKKSLCNQVEGSCSTTYGFIIAIIRLI